MWAAFLLGDWDNLTRPGGSVKLCRRDTAEDGQDAAAGYLRIIGEQRPDTDTWQPHGSHRYVLTDSDGEPVSVTQYGRDWQVVVAEVDPLEDGGQPS
jgi:hypothetical protein